jgi:hypothetical protein
MASVVWKGSGRARDLAYRRGGELFGQPLPTGAINPRLFLSRLQSSSEDMQIVCRIAIGEQFECLGENIDCF